MESERWQLVLADGFAQGLRDAAAYYAHGGTRAVEAFLDRYEEVLDCLAVFPEMGATVDEGPERWVPIKNFIAVYEIDEAAHRVGLAYLFYERMDWRGRLKSKG